MQSRTDNDTRPNSSLRPLQTVTVTLSCGCVREWPGSEETAPRRGMVLTCFSHMEEVTVDKVEVK